MSKEDVESIAKELNLPVNVVEKTYKAYWKFIKDTIEALPLKEDITEEEFNKLRTNFNIPSIGKLCCTLDKFNRTKRKFNYIRKIRSNAKDNKD